MRYMARWTPLGGRWSLAVTDETEKVVAFARTDVRASHEHPGSEYLREAGFARFAGGFWQEEPAGWWCPVLRLEREPASPAQDRGAPGS